MFGVYEIQETVGQGGMGVVYRAHDTALDRIVALKVLKEDLRANKQIAARFQREAQAIASLSHPGIIHIFAVGAVGRIPFISMEFIEGLTLSQLMKREKRIPWKRALHIAEQVAEALACAHDAHIIHRDIKPGNVLLAADDRAYVTDFGIAKVLTAETQLTVEGSRLGTPNYMSPERCMNREITPSSDIYSLGIVLFQMISGRLPYEAPSPVDLIRKIVTEPPARLSEHVSDVPPDVERLVAYLIEKKPEARPADASEVARMCRRVIEGEPLSEESAVASSLREFRDSDPSTSTGSTGVGDAQRLRSPIIALRRMWRGASPAGKLWAAGVGVIVVAGVLGQLAVLEANEGLARHTVNQWDRSTSGWVRSASPAEFTQESQGVTLARVNLPLMSPVQLLATGANHFAIALERERGGTDSALGAVCVLTADPPYARIVLPPGPRNGGTNASLLLGSEPNASPAFPNADALVLGQRRRQVDGSWMSEVLHVDASLSDASYGRPLLSGESFSTSEGFAVDSIYLAEVSPWKPEIAFATCDVSGSVHSLFIATLRIGEVAGNPAQLGEADGRVVRMAFEPDGALFVATMAGDGALAIKRHSASGRAEPMFSSQDANAQIADLTADGAAIVDGAAPDRVVTFVDLSTRERISVGAGVNAAIAPRGEFIFVTAADHRGSAQVYRVDIGTPEERTQLTFLARGVGPDLAVSRDGRFVVATLAEHGTPSLVLIDVAEAVSAP